jgi:hypothetical protein
VSIASSKISSHSQHSLQTERGLNFPTNLQLCSIKMSKQPISDELPPPAYSEINMDAGPSMTQLGYDQPFSSQPYPTQAMPVISQPMPMGSTMVTVAPTHGGHQQSRNIMIINARSKKILANNRSNCKFLRY